MNLHNIYNYVAAYIIVGFLTFGHIFNSTYTPIPDCGVRPHSIDERVAYEVWEDCRQKQIEIEFGTGDKFQVGFPSFLGGLLWPVYWGGSIALRITK